MQVGTGAAAGGEPAEVSRQELYGDYVRCHRESCAEGPPCRDVRLLERAAEYLAREPTTSPGTFTVFPFYRAVAEDRGPVGPDRGRHLSALVKAAELLETLCVNLFLQPWKKEFKTLKTFTGPFVYCLLPALSSSTIQSVLASIGYLPHDDVPPSEYRLREDAKPDEVMLVGFELLLARVECLHLLDILEKDQPGPEEWLEVLRKRVGTIKLEEPAEKKARMTVKKEEEAEEEKKKKKEEEGVDQRELPVYSDTRCASKPQARPRHHRLANADQSIMEMQRTYPDLAFRGRPLLPDKLPRAKSGDDGKAGSEVKAEQSPKPGQCQPTAEASSWLQQQGATGVENKKPPRQERPSLSSADEEERDLRELAQRMQQLDVQETAREEATGKAENKSGENADKDRRRMRGRRTSAEGEEEEEDEVNPVKPVEERVAALIRVRFSTSSQHEPVPVCPPSARSAADAQGGRGGGGVVLRRRREGDDTVNGRGRGERGEGVGGEEEKLAQDFVMV